MKKRMFQNPSKTILILIVCADIVYALAVSVVGHFMSTKLVENKKGLADTIVKDINKDLDWIDKNLLDTVIADSIWKKLQKNDEEPLESLAAFSSLQKNYSITKEQYGQNYNFFLTDFQNKRLRELTAVHLPFESYVKMKRFLQEETLENYQRGKWKIVTLEAEKYFYTFYRFEDRVIGAWIDEASLLNEFKSLEIGGNGRISLCEGNEMSLEAGSSDTMVYLLGHTDNKVGIQVKEDHDKYFFLLMIPQYIIVVIGGLLIFSAFSLYRYMKRNVLQPMEQFSELLYKKELEKKQMELNFRKIQIRPHFLINCLTGVYYMVEHGESEKVKQMLVQISDYLRQILKSGLELVDFGQEVETICNYVDIQSDLYVGSIKLNVDYRDAEVEEMKLPALLLITFIENSIHQARKKEKNLELWLYAEKQKENMLYMKLKDDAGGFPEKLLADLNTQDLPVQEEEGHHLGINNALKRLQLMYSGRAKCIFSNCADGACVELWIPQTEE